MGRQVEQGAPRWMIEARHAGFVPRRGRLGARDIAVFDHRVKDLRLPRVSSLRMEQWIVERGVLRNPRQNRGLRQIKLLGGALAARGVIAVAKVIVCGSV